MSEHNPLEEFVREYHGNPVGFVRDILGAEPLPYQAEFLEALADGERKMSVRSGHGTGKSTAASLIRRFRRFDEIFFFPRARFNSDPEFTQTR